MGLVLEAENLTKDYNGIRAVDHLDFEVREGEIFGLLGPNGAGKTTTIRMLSTVILPTEGTARILGRDIRKESLSVRRSIGVLTMDVGLYDRFTARENVRYFGRLYGMGEPEIERRTEELVDLLEMRDFADRRAGSFSTGMRQKVAIARAMIHDPHLLMLDEPTTGLDVLASQTVLGFIKRSRDEGKTVILSTHMMPVAQKLCDRVCVIHEGKLVALDRIEAILQSTGAADLEDAFIAMVRE
jgi:sodium transport system ATP-binding protein